MRFSSAFRLPRFNLKMFDRRKVVKTQPINITKKYALTAFKYHWTDKCIHETASRINNKT